MGPSRRSCPRALTPFGRRAAEYSSPPAPVNPHDLRPTSLRACKRPTSPPGIRGRSATPIDPDIPPRMQATDEPPSGIRGRSATPIDPYIPLRARATDEAPPRDSRSIGHADRPRYPSARASDRRGPSGIRGRSATPIDPDIPLRVRATDEAGVLGRNAADHAGRGASEHASAEAFRPPRTGHSTTAPSAKPRARSLSDPRGIRTLVTSVKGRCPRPG